MVSRSLGLLPVAIKFAFRPYTEYYRNFPQILSHDNSIVYGLHHLL